MSVYVIGGKLIGHGLEIEVRDDEEENGALFECRTREIPSVCQRPPSCAPLFSSDGSTDWGRYI